VTVQFRYQGDGLSTGTNISWRLDSSRLHIEGPIGPMPDANRAGMCGWNGWGTFGALYANFGGSALPTANTLVCEVTVIVRDNAQPGRANIRGVAPVCANATGSALPCQVFDSWIEVLGAPSAMDSSRWFEHDTLELEVLLREALPGPAQGQSESSASLLAALGNRGLLLRNLPNAARRAMGRPMQPAEAAYYAAHPHSAGAQLHRSLIVALPSEAARDLALAELRSAAAVEWVAPRRMPAMRLPPASDQATANETPTPAGGKSGAQVVPQDHLATLGITHSPLSSLPGGWGLVAVVDAGIDVEHPELKSFTGAASVGGSHIHGGNYLPYFSVNMGAGNQPPDNLDEQQANLVGKPGSLPAACDPNGDGTATPTALGHGTHVAGLIGANAIDDAGVSGVCRYCGLAIIKSTSLTCTTLQPRTLALAFNFDAGMDPATVRGAQVINLSGGRQSIACSGAPSQPDLCKKVAAAFQERDVFVVASSGNDREPIQGPANSKFALAAGGSDQSGALWDDSPGGYEGCAFFPDNPTDERECGSNYTTGSPPGYSLGKQELVALATNVWSTVYRGADWNARIRCGDSFGGGSPVDGIGLCTGTSMSAPIIAGVIGLLRSIHPLLPVGALDDPVNPTAATGLRKLLAATASGMQWHPQTGWGQLNGADWSPRLGWGAPDVVAAAQGLLGWKDGEPVVNRAIPLFSLLHVNGDHAAVATPQLTMALRDAGYAHDGDEIPGYLVLPRHPYYGAPRARAFVLSTEFTPQSSTLKPVPLYLMVKIINIKNDTRDHILVSSLAQVQIAADAGYAYAGRQGYVYPYCSSQPGCTMPLGTEPLHLKCRQNPVRCAVFPDRDVQHFGALGFNQPFPGITDPLGYAYWRGDADFDGLPDAAEYVLGTDPNLADTDGDLVDDGIEYPFAGVPARDPCDGTLKHRCAVKVAMFRHGFEAVPAP